MGGRYRALLYLRGLQPPYRHHLVGGQRFDSRLGNGHRRDRIAQRVEHLEYTAAFTSRRMLYMIDEIRDVTGTQPVPALPDGEHPHQPAVAMDGTAGGKHSISPQWPWMALRAGIQSGRRDSNPRHPAWEASALPTELRPRNFAFPLYPIRPAGATGRPSPRLVPGNPADHMPCDVAMDTIGQSFPSSANLHLPIASRSRSGRFTT